MPPGQSLPLSIPRECSAQGWGRGARWRPEPGLGRSPGAPRRLGAHRKGGLARHPLCQGGPWRGIVPRGCANRRKTPTGLGTAQGRVSGRPFPPFMVRGCLGPRGQRVSCASQVWLTRWLRFLLSLLTLWKERTPPSGRFQGNGSGPGGVPQRTILLHLCGGGFHVRLLYRGEKSFLLSFLKSLFFIVAIANGFF